MKVSELREYLEVYPDDHDVLVEDSRYETLHNVINHTEWRHFQTGESLGTVILVTGDAV